MRNWLIAVTAGAVIGANGAAFGQSSVCQPPIGSVLPNVLNESVGRSPSEILSVQGSEPSAPSAVGGDAAGDGAAKEDNGTNPASNITTFIFSNEYYTLDGGNRINTSYARLKFPTYGGRGSVLFETPFVYYAPNGSLPVSQTGVGGGGGTGGAVGSLPNIGGLGDIRIQGSFNTWTSCDKKLSVINLLEAFLPTADNAIVNRGDNGNQLTAFNLGTGKFVLGPGLGVVYAFAPNFIVAPLYFYEASVFGNDDRPTIRRGKLRVFGMYAWDSGAYVLPEFQILTNYLTGNNDIYVAPELGYSHKKTTLYVKPGIGIDPDKNDRQWGLELGCRVQF